MMQLLVSCLVPHYLPHAVRHAVSPWRYLAYIAFGNTKARQVPHSRRVRQVPHSRRVRHEVRVCVASLCKNWLRIPNSCLYCLATLTSLASPSAMHQRGMRCILHRASCILACEDEVSDAACEDEVGDATLATRDIAEAIPSAIQ